MTGFPRSSAELIKNTSTVSPTTLPTVKDALDNLGGRTPSALPVSIAEGGTGQITASAAFNALGLGLLTTRGQVIRRGATALEALTAQTANTFLGGDGTDVTARTVAQVLTSLGLSVPVTIAQGGTGQTTKAAAFDALSPMTTLGDLISYNGGNVRVAVGAADTFLGSTGAAVPSYRTVAQVLASLGLSVPVTIAQGGTGQTAKTAAFDALSPVTTLGDIIARDASNNVRVAVGAADTFLGSTGAAVPSYRTAAQVRTSIGYEVGTFTPTMAFATVGTSTWAYGGQTGVYIKFARMVWIHIFMSGTPTKGTGAGEFRIDGLPFTPDLSFTPLTVDSMTVNWTWPAGRTAVAAFPTSGTTYLRLDGFGTGVGDSIFAIGNMADGLTHQIGISGIYRTAS